jgi:hypothetical protein
MKNNGPTKRQKTGPTRRQKSRQATGQKISSTSPQKLLSTSSRELLSSTRRKLFSTTHSKFLTATDERFRPIYFAILAGLIPLLVAWSKFGFSIKNISSPLYLYGDEFLYADHVASLMWSGGLQNHIFGAPLGQDLNHAFLSVDNGPAFIASLLGRFVDNPYFGLNSYLLLTFALTGVTTFFAAKLLGSKNLSALASGVLLSLVFQHFAWSTQAITLSSFFPIPIILAIATLQINSNSSRPLSLHSRRAWLSWLIFCFAFGMFYSYYTLGFVFIIGTYVVLLSISRASLKPIVSVFSSMATILVGFLISAIPSLLAEANTVGGINYLKMRDPWAAFVNAGSFLQSIIPIPGTISANILKFFFPSLDMRITNFRGVFSSLNAMQEGWSAPVILPICFIAILTLYFRGYITKKIGTSEAGHISTLLYIMLISIFWSWAGGLGTTFAVFFSGALRGYARFAIFTLAAIILAAAYAFSIALAHLGTRNIGIWILAISLFGLALFDELSVPIGMRAGTTELKVQSINQMTNKFPKDCSVLQFPVVHYPYEPPGYPAYRLLAPGLVTKRRDLSWSAGAVGGSKSWVNLEQFRTYEDSVGSDLISKAKKAGFCTILVDVDAWNAFHDFRPTPSYSNSPLLSVDKFVKSLGNSTSVHTSFGEYYVVPLQ